MVTRREIAVRGTPVHLLTDGAGPPLLYLHGASAGGRWLPFQEQLAEHFTVICPVHPGHGGSPAADWIRHISDLAFLYLDLLDELKLDRVHLAGASFGGWIAAEIAVMASHRLESLTLIDPVGIKVDGWIYPFLFAMELPEMAAVTFHNLEAAIALAPTDWSVDTIAEAQRERAAIARVSWNPYLYNPLLKRRLERIAARTMLVWGEEDRLAPLKPCGVTWSERIPNAKLLVVPDTGHLPHIEAPAKVAEAVVAFAEEGPLL